MQSEARKQRNLFNISNFPLLPSSRASTICYNDDLVYSYYSMGDNTGNTTNDYGEKGKPFPNQTSYIISFTPLAAYRNCEGTHPSHFIRVIVSKC